MGILVDCPMPLPADARDYASFCRFCRVNLAGCGGLCARCAFRRCVAVRPARAATSAPPGSAAKIEVMRRRFEAGEAIFHPDDPTLRNGDADAA